MFLWVRLFCTSLCRPMPNYNWLRMCWWEVAWCAMHLVGLDKTMLLRNRGPIWLWPGVNSWTHNTLNLSPLTVWRIITLLQLKFRLAINTSCPRCKLGLTTDNVTFPLDSAKIFNYPFSLQQMLALSWLLYYYKTASNIYRIAGKFGIDHQNKKKFANCTCTYGS